MIAAKDDLDQHGEWLELIERQLPLKRTTSAILMKIAANSVLANVDHLTASWRTLYELTKLPAPELIARIEDGVINPKMQRKDVMALRGIVPRQRAANHEGHFAFARRLLGLIRPRIAVG